MNPSLAMWDNRSLIHRGLQDDTSAKAGCRPDLMSRRERASSGVDGWKRRHSAHQLCDPRPVYILKLP